MVTDLPGSMQYDSKLHAYIDPDTGDVIPLQEGDVVPPSSSKSKIKPTSSSSPAKTSSTTYDEVSRNSQEGMGEGAGAGAGAGMAEGAGLSQIERDHQLALQLELGEAKMENAPRSFDAIYSGGNMDYVENYGDKANNANSGQDSDMRFAYYLQMMEFELSMEIPDDGDFTTKELGASSSCKRQLLTISTVLCIIQIVLMIVILAMSGFAPVSENPMLGPSGEALVRFGAKQASLEVYKRQWWRLFTAIMLHAGIVHLLSNVFIQLRVGGYLELVFGRYCWCAIYLLSGVFGNMMSTIFLPNTIGVGSSGSLLGMLTAWAVWIVFRWRKIPERYHRQRNCQLGIVVSSVVITLATSFAPYVDWAAHFGGAVQGLFWGAILLSKELDNVQHKWMVRAFFFACSAGTICYASYYMTHVLKPNPDFVDYFDENDGF
jgi:membrane associated rhomboid family serine protease